MTLVESDVTTTDLAAMDLEGLARIANSEHAQVEARARAAVGEISHGVLHGIRAGEALMEAKSRHDGNSNWTEWLDKNVGFRRATAQTYMRWAFYKDEITQLQDVPVTTHNLRQLLRGLPMVPRTTDRRTVPDEDRQEIKELVTEGVSAMEVARRFDVHHSTVRRITDPDYDRKAKEKLKRKRDRQAAAKKALDRQERDAAAKRAGGDVAKSYSLVRQLASALDAAMSDADTGRDDLRMALTYAHRAEDHISAAIRKA